MKAIVIHQAGGPEVLQYEDVADPRPGSRELLVRVAAAGINFSDLGTRRRALDLPIIAGSEAAGSVIQLGADVTDFQVSDVVAFQPVPGSYAELVVVPVDAAVRLPTGMDPSLAAASMLQGRTAYAMSHHAYPIQPGDRVLIHAAAGGVGLLLTQLAKMAGAFVFATVGSGEKFEAVQEAGADFVINYSKDDFAEVVNGETSGDGVNAIYDSVGATTFEKSLTCLGQRGTIVVFGRSSGPIPPFDLGLLSRSGGYVTSTNARKFAPTLELWREHTNQVFDWVHGGQLKVFATRYPLAQAADAHRALQDRATIGKQLLIP